MEKEWKNIEKPPFFHPKSMSIDPKSIKTPSKTYHTSIKPCKIHQNSIKNYQRSIKPCKIHQNSIKHPSNIHQTLQNFPDFPWFFRLFQDRNQLFSPGHRDLRAPSHLQRRAALAPQARLGAPAPGRGANFFVVFFGGFPMAVSIG